MIRVDIFRNGLLSIVAEKNSQVEFIKVQNLSHCGINFETVKISAMEKAQVTLYDIQLGAKINGASTSTYMPEEWAEVQIYPLYFADKTRRIDLEQNFIINGKNSPPSWRAWPPAWAPTPRTPSPWATAATTLK